MRVRVVFLLSLFIYTAGTIHAQDKCATVPYMQNLLQEKGIKQSNEQFEQQLQYRQFLKNQQNRTQREHAGPYQIPVVFHIIHNGESSPVFTEVTDAKVLSQLEVLNDDFRRMNADATNTPAAFAPLAGSMDIEFVLAKQSPEGLPTTGINRVHGNRSGWSTSLDEELKALSYWPAEDYLNIWVTNISGGFLGYAQFPVSNMAGLEDYQSGIAATDGVVIDYTTFGVGSSDPDYNLGRTTTHEVGHFLGLRHIWGDTDDCSGTDYVSDTPNQADETYGCPSHPVSDCGNPKMFQNYMDYTDDACMNLFTQGQANRITLVLENDDIPRRGSLLTSHGLEDPVCGSNPIVDAAIFNIEEPGLVTCNENPMLIIGIKNMSCPIITSVRFEYSVNGSTPVSKLLTGLSIFNNGTEELLEIGNLSLSEGENLISLEVINVNSQQDDDPDNSTKEFTIIHSTESDIIPLRKNFDDDQISDWIVASPHDVLWDIDEYQARFPAAGGSVGEESWLVSPVLDFSAREKASLFFELYYTWNSTDNDRLKILASTDCGDSYIPLVPGFDQSGSNLNNNGEKRFVNLNSLAGSDNIRIAFVATSDAGSNIYIDNIEFFTSDNPDPIETEGKPFSIYWNQSGGVDITFNLNERQHVELSVVDIMGRELTRASLPEMLNQTFTVPAGNVPSGLYVIRVEVGKKYYTTKVYLSP